MAGWRAGHREVDVGVAAGLSAGLSAIVLAGCLLAGCLTSEDPPRATAVAPKASPSSFTRVGAVESASGCGGNAGSGLPAMSALGSGSICEADGWCWYNSTPSGAWLRGIAAAGGADVWIGGASEMAFHYDGTGWSATPTGLELTEAIWAFAADDVWASGMAVGGGAAVAHGDGSSFGAPISLPIGEAMEMWGSAANDLYAVGWGGLMHFDGASWTAVPGVAGTAIAGTASDDIWVANYDGIKHFDGSAWLAVPEMQSRYVIDIAVTAPASVWAAVLENGGTTVYHFDGSTWTNRFRETGSGVSVHGIAARSDTDVWLFGSHYGPALEQIVYGYVAHFDGTSWTVGADAPAPLYEVASLPHGTFGVGMGGRVVQLSPTTATACADLTSGPVNLLWSAWASSPNDVWAVGSRGAAVHFDGQTVTAVPTGVTTELIDVWGTGPDDVWAVGRAGVALHYNGSAWQPVITGTTLDLFAVFAGARNDVWMGGPNGTLLHHNGIIPTPAIAPGLTATMTIYDIHGTGPSDVWITGGDDSLGGFVAHYDGLLWSAPQTLSSPSVPFLRVWAVAANDVWTASSEQWRRNYDYWHYDGTDWTEHYQEPSSQTWMFPVPPLSTGGNSHRGSFAFGPQDVWSVGDFGTIVRRTTASP